MIVNKVRNVVKSNAPHPIPQSRAMEKFRDISTAKAVAVPVEVPKAKPYRFRGQMYEKMLFSAANAAGALFFALTAPLTIFGGKASFKSTTGVSFKVQGSPLAAIVLSPVAAGYAAAQAIKATAQFVVAPFYFLAGR